MLKQISKFLRDENGATAVEYGLIAGLLAVLIIGVLTLAGGSLKTIFSKIQTGLSTAASSR
jgi:pilus assembly protein Flp/PilA